VTLDGRVFSFFGQTLKKYCLFELTLLTQSIAFTDIFFLLPTKSNKYAFVGVFGG